jgi:hypothetical protein
MGLGSGSALAQGMQASSGTGSYSNLVADAALSWAQQVSSNLSTAGFIPTESFTNATVTLEGQSSRPSVRVLASICEYSFRNGSLQIIRRRDLFEDKGPASLILQHLTNEVLALTRDAAPHRALEALQCLCYPTNRIQEVYRFNVRDDLMDAYPIRNGGPNFPQDLHFYGELISRKKIKMSVGMGLADPIALGDGQRLASPARIDLLATTGELLEAWWLPDFETLERLGVRGPEPIRLPDTPDFAPPRFVSATRKLTAAEAGSQPIPVVDVVRDAWTQLEQQLGTNRPKCILVCENLNDPAAVVAEMAALAGNVLWAGASHFFRFDLPFDTSQMQDLAQGKRGVRLLAICGGVETWLEVLSDLKPIPPPSEGDLARLGGQEKWKHIYDEERQRLGPQVDDLLGRLNIPEKLPDHAIFLICATIPFPAGSVIQSELPARLRGKA